ncbi:pentapeptide repeat-containing protein [Haemophilus influenzae]|uniref:pentapeptide repeat-containing protein n=1 Tax=Haemophilus influenzae TaxID=727 RepID=UPI0007668832|nr:pentapeptide repeat-containing protein [Haemophilus influenzae]PRK01925.1 Pentapeptide repeats (8 copies) [Haemophilus influenzae]PRK02644.1 Pentapeptide repeats (8 copies) [Haemophilus influenzae]PRM75866.1 Pentapeptide repeats (8 copies) [Haemophilus influenzae]CWW45751.1 Pentapeptide repeats (8 copies) [Haemophilus influenzae]CWX17153.1 Pentapeptide repeats (8 copies) [Haemophilus influenzae]
MKDFWNKIPNWIKVILSSLISIFIILNFKKLSLLFSDESNNEIIKQGGFWTLFSLIVSSPIAFVIWSFRDQNATDQINNSRKDTNLKEYHKIVEWITNKDSSDELKISAIYYLRRFYEDKSLGFQQAALHLLLSTWEFMQKNELEKLEKVNDKAEAKSIINSLRENGNSPLGIAITKVLLSNEGKCILAYPEVFSSICLAGMNFYLPGLSNDIVNNLFNNDKIKYSGIQLQGCQFRDINLKDVDLSYSNLLGTEWGSSEFCDESFWNNVNFKECDFRYSYLTQIVFKKCDFSSSNFMNATLAQLDIDGSTSFWGLNLIHSSMIFISLTKSSQFIGSIIFQSDLANWIYESQDEFDYEQKEYTLEEVKEFGVFVLCNGNKQYRSCQLILSGKTIFPPNFTYSLENISVSYDEIKKVNDGWNFEIKGSK